jgi:hypothetical protein
MKKNLIKLICGTALLGSMAVDVSNRAQAQGFIGSSGMFWEFFIGRDKGLIPRSGKRYRF